MHTYSYRYSINLNMVNYKQWFLCMNLGDTINIYSTDYLTRCRVFNGNGKSIQRDSHIMGITIHEHEEIRCSVVYMRDIYKIRQLRWNTFFRMKDHIFTSGYKIKNYEWLGKKMRSINSRAEENKKRNMEFNK